MHDEIWLDDKDYPDEHDIEVFGYDSPPDYDPLTIGYIGESRPAFWTEKRIILLIITVFIVLALLLPVLIR